MATDKQKAIESKKVKTPEFRLSFPAIFKPKAFEQQEPKFSIVMLFDKKKADLAGLKKAVAYAAQEKWGAKEKWPKNLRLPFRDGDEKEDMEGYKGHTYVSASSKQAPQIVDYKGPGVRPEPIMESDGKAYAGCYARATLIAFAYDKAGNKGVSFSLQNVQILRDGKPFSGRKNADDEFSDDFEVENNDAENPDNYESSSDDSDDLGLD